MKISTNSTANSWYIDPLRLLFWLIQALWLATALSMGVAQADTLEPVEAGQENAILGQAADVGSTGVGLLVGAAEANPLGLVTLGVKAIAYEKIKSSPPVEQPRLWGIYGAMGWGATANNLCVIATIATGGSAAVLCPLLGLGTGLGSWAAGSDERDRATFAVICNEAKIRNPDLQCTYTAPQG